MEIPQILEMAMMSACESRSKSRVSQRNAFDELWQGLDWSQDFNVKLNTGVSSFFHFSLETNKQ